MNYSSAERSSYITWQKVHMSSHLSQGKRMNGVIASMQATECTIEQRWGSETGKVPFRRRGKRLGT